MREDFCGSAAWRKGMKRWNGWGEEMVTAPLAAATVAFLRQVVGTGVTPQDTILEEIASRIPPSRLPPRSGILCDPVERIRHARGQSLPDWIALRSGSIDTFPDGVAFPESESEVRGLLDYADKFGVHLI